ncbi:MAG: response regulator [Treponema sp.]|nr:response regulator [Treponema sp.]
MKILIVDDEKPILELIKYNLEKEGYSTIIAENATSALAKARSEKPNLILLDLMLPDMSGLDVTRILKNDTKTSDIPIIMVTAKTEDSDIVIGLELGADDYITKPFSPKVLLARLKSVIRRIYENPASKDNFSSNEEINIFDIRIFPIKHRAFKNGNEMLLSKSEYALLEYFIKSPGQVFSRQQIINALKGDDYPVTERAIDVLVLALRKKLDEAGGISNLIETLRGIGYRFKEE